MIIEGRLSRRGMSSVSSTGEKHRKTEKKERRLTAGEGGGGGVGAKSLDGKKGWSSINHSILSAWSKATHAGICNPFLCLYTDIKQKFIK